MESVTITKEIDIVTLWRLLFNTDLKDHAVLYDCSMRTNYEPGDFRMLHTKEFMTVSGRNQRRLYILLVGYQSSRGTIPNEHKSYIEYNGETRRTLYSVHMPANYWLELIDHTGLESLAPLREYYEQYLNEAVSVIDVEEEPEQES